MPADDLKPNRETDPADGGNQAEWVADLSPAFPARPEGRWRALGLAVVLSLAVHASLLTLFHAWPGDGTGSTGVGSLVVDTRVPGPEVDCLIDFPEEVARSRPGSQSPPAHEPAAAPQPSVPTPAPETSSLGPRENRGVSGTMRSRPDGIHSPTASGNVAEGPGISFFQILARGRRVVYVIDRSASMGLNGTFRVATRELLASLARLPDDAWFQVIAYNRGNEPLRLAGRVGLLPASPDLKGLARQQIETLRAEGGTDHLAALKRALLLQPDVLFFLSDADDLTAEQVREVTRFNRGRTVIHVVGLTWTPTERESPPQELARANGGVYRAVGSDSLTKKLPPDS